MGGSIDILALMLKVYHIETVSKHLRVDQKTSCTSRSSSERCGAKLYTWHSGACTGCRGWAAPQA
jgi:hypothetical protein